MHLRIFLSENEMLILIRMTDVRARIGALCVKLPVAKRTSFIKVPSQILDVPLLIQVSANVPQ